MHFVFALFAGFVGAAMQVRAGSDPLSVGVGGFAGAVAGLLASALMLRWISGRP